jgi:sulfonate transport system substrate-binding protein
MNVNAIDFGQTGETPPVFAQAAGGAIVYIANEPPSPKGEALLVLKDSPIKSVSELKGKSVAYARGANSNYFAVKALAKAGINYGDYRSVHLAPADARAAFESGQVDAWAIWDPYYAAAEAAGNVRVLTDGEGIVANLEFYLARKIFADENPKAVEVVLAELKDLDVWVKTHPAEAAAELAIAVGIPASILETALKRQSYGLKPIDASVIAAQQSVADEFHALKILPKAIKVEDIVWKAGS